MNLLKVNWKKVQLTTAMGIIMKVKFSNLKNGEMERLCTLLAILTKDIFQTINLNFKESSNGKMETITKEISKIAKVMAMEN